MLLKLMFTLASVQRCAFRAGGAGLGCLQMSGFQDVRQDLPLDTFHMKGDTAVHTVVT